MREAVSIFDHSGIKSPQINTKPKGPILLSNTTALAHGLLEHLIAPI